MKFDTNYSSVNAKLALSDGTVICGKGFGYPTQVTGEVVFNTGMTGYVEMMTDPSYKGQILMFTYPLIGNYGIPPDFESGRVQAEGLIVNEVCKDPSHHRSSETLVEWLYESKTPGIEGIDTRYLTRKLRKYGVLPGTLSCGEIDTDELLEKARSFDISRIDLVKKVTCSSAERYEVGGDCDVVLIDCGSKSSIIKELNQRGINVISVPAWSNEREILEFDPDGIVVSNGPGDPAVPTYLHRTIRKLLGEIPVLGICFGHQIVAISAGASTFKMKFGHRGVNHPVRDLDTGRIHITSQNHGYAINERSLEGTGFVANKVNANDLTIEGLLHNDLPVMTIQYHPEASPGPRDNRYIFDDFVAVL